MPKRDRGENWDDYRFLLAVARMGTVSAAAQRLRVDHATVIRRIDRLERDLGVVLFSRRPTGYELTAAGKKALALADGVESAILSGQSSLGQLSDQPTGTVRIGAPDGFGSYFLAPRLVGLIERFPGLDVQLVATARMFSLARREADLAISLHAPEEGRLLVRKLTDYELRLYGSNKYLDRHPPIYTMADLAQHRFTGYIEELLYTPELDYLSLVCERHQVCMRSVNLIAQLQATVAGIGLAILPCFMAKWRRDLLPVLPNDFSLRRSFWLLIHEDSRDNPAVRAVSRHIGETVEAERDLFEG
jgi:DNA-binding transcriptional LysR family regulator